MQETNILSLRGRRAALSRSRTPDDQDLLNAQRDLAAAGLERHVSRVVDAAPPLTNEQRERIASLLAPQAVIQGAA